MIGYGKGQENPSAPVQRMVLENPIISHRLIDLFHFPPEVPSSDLTNLGADLLNLAYFHQSIDQQQQENNFCI